MLHAGIAWTGAGYELALLDDAGRDIGREAALPTRWDAARVAELVHRLRAAAAALAQPLTVVIDSSNGLLDGPLTAAGLAVRRADPWQLPPRPVFGSVPARALAECSRVGMDLARLTPSSGTLGGRAEEFEDGLRRSAPLREALTAAGRCVEHGRRDRPQVALSFDDGPDPVFTRRILAVLCRYDARATFFCVGLHAAALPEELRRIAAAGHELGNHSWSHPYLPDLTPAQLREQLDRTTEAVAAATGVAPVRFRPPYGAQTPELLTALTPLAAELTLWDVDARDWSRPGPERIAATVLDAVRPGSIVLLHEGAGDRRQTVEALPAVLEGLLARGLQPVTIAELLAPERAMLSRPPAASPAGPP